MHRFDRRVHANRSFHQATFLNTVICTLTECLIHTALGASNSNGVNILELRPQDIMHFTMVCFSKIVLSAS